MSASKKKRMGSQRRPLNPNLQESPKTSDAAKSPPIPKGRQRADARADLTPGSAESEIPARKFSSNRGSEEKLHFKDVTSESSLKPFEEVEDTTYSQDPYFLGIKNESIDELLEKKSAPGSGLADFDLLLNQSSYVSTSAVTEAISSVPQTSDTLDTNMETKSDLLLTEGQNKKYVKPKIASTQEGVSEKDLAQQMSDILEATLPAGVTGESTCPVSLIGQEDINITGSHECTNKINSGEDEAGHIEKPVCQQSDKSSLPTAKIRKLGSSRRGKGTNIKGLQHQGDDMALESNISANVLEKNDLTIVQKTQDVIVDTPAEDIYRNDQLNMNQTSKDDLSVDSRHLLEVKTLEKPQVVELLADFKDQEDEKNKAYEKVVGPQDFSELSSIEIPPMDDTKAPQSSPHPEITVSVGVEEVKILEISDYSTQQVLGGTDEAAENITIQDSLTTSGITATLKDDTYSKDNPFDNDFFATDKEFKDETIVRSSLSSKMPSELETGKSSIKEFITTKDELSELMFGAQMGMQSSTEELLHFDQNDNSDLLNVSASPKLEDKNEMYAAQTENVCQVTSSVSVTDEDKDNSSVDPTNIKDSFSEYKKIDIIDQPLETLITFTDVVSTVPGQIYAGENQEENVKLSDESQILNKEDIIAPPNTSLDDVCDDTDKSITAEGFLKTETIATVVQESILKTYPEENVNNDLFDIGGGNHEKDVKCFKEETIESRGSEQLDMLLHSKDEVVTEPIGEHPEIHATTTELQNKEYNILNVTTRPEFDVSSSVNVAHGGVDDNSAGFRALGESTDKLFFSETNSEENERDGSGSTNNVVLLEQQPESLISFTLSTDPGQGDQETIKPAVEEVVDLQSVKSSEPQEPQIQQTVDTDASLTYPHPKVTADVQDGTSAHSQLIGNRRKLGSSRKIKERKQANDELKPEEKSEEIITPIIVTEETQTEAVLHKQDQISATDTEEHEDKVDKGLSQLVYDEPQETVKETNDEAILSSENLLQQEPPSTDISNDGQSEDNEPKVYVEEEKHTLPNKELDFVQVQEDLPEVGDGENQPTELNKSNDNVQIRHTDDIDAPLASPQPDVSVDVEDVTAVGSQFTGNRRKLRSSRRTKEQKQDNNESKKEEIDITPNEKIEIPQVASGIEKKSQDIAIDSDIVGKLDQSFIQVHDEALETVATPRKYLKPAVEEVVDLQSVKSSEPQEPQIQQTVDTDASLTSPHPKVTADVQDGTSAHSQLIGNRRKLGSSRKIKGKKQVNDELKPEEKSEEIITPIIVTEESQTEAVLHKQGQISATDTEEHEDKVDNGLSQLVYDEPQETVKETNDEAILSSENLLQQEPSSTDISNDGQSEDNEPKIYVEEEKHTLPNKEVDFVQVQEDLPKVGDGENQPTELNKSNDNVQIPHTDDINAPLASPHPDVSVDVEDVTAVGSQFTGNRRKLGSSRRTKEQKQDNIESKKEEIDITPNEKIEIPQVASGIEKEGQDIAIDSDIVRKELDQGFIQVHDEALETVATTSKHLKPTEVTALFEEEQTVEENASKDGNTQPNIIDSIIENVIPEQSKVDSLFRQESPTELQNTEQSEVKTRIYALKEPINVHQLTYISDNETHEEIDNSFLLQAEQPVQGETTGEPSEAVPLVHVTKVNEPNADLAHGPRRKLGSSRRMKERKPANDEKSNDSKDIGNVTELVQSTPTEDLLQQELNNPNFASEVTKEDNSKPEDAKDTMFLLSDKEQTVSSEEKENNIQEKSIIEEIQKEITAVDSFTVKDLKDKAVAEADSTPEETVKAKTEDTIQSVVMSAKDQQDVQDMKVLLTTAEPQINSGPKKRKMGSTRRSQLDRKQQDEKRETEDNVAIFDSSAAMHEKESIAIVNEDAETLSTDIFVEQKEISVSVVSPVEQPKEDERQAERQKVAQEEVLQTEEAALIEGMHTGATLQNPQSITNEGIHPSSPGKRRKMGSTRKNLTPKKESPPEEIVTAINVGKEVVSSISNQNNESKEHSGLFIHAAPVHEQPPDEETPLSQQDNQENLRSEPELEVSSHPDLMTEEAAVARRRKMGSHRKPHTDQSVKQGKEKEENLAHPMEEQRAESPKLGRISEVSERDASAFNIKGDSRPMSQKIPQLSQPSTNVRRIQQSNIRLAAGYDPSASKYEVVMIGDSSVGKTSFMQRAQSGRFSPDIPASIGMDSYKWPVVVDGRTVVLHLWDTAGQERFHSMTKQIFHRAQAFLLMYDITCAQTFTAVTYWANCIKEGAGENVVILLLGNKSDNKERKVRREEGELLAQENGFVFIECSAATGENVIEALETVARLLSQKIARREEPLELRKPEPKNKKCC